MCSAIDLACSSPTPEMALLCGGVLVDTPLVMYSCDLAYIQACSLEGRRCNRCFAFVIRSVQAAPSSAHETEGRVRNIAAGLTKTLHFVSTFLTD